MAVVGEGKVRHAVADQDEVFHSASPRHKRAQPMARLGVGNSRVKIPYETCRIKRTRVLMQPDALPISGAWGQRGDI